MKPNPLFADLNHIFNHTRDLWDDLRGARLFITGGTGFFGCWLLESFLFANHKIDLKASVVVLTRRPDVFNKSLPHLALDPAVTLVKGDVCDFEFPKGEFSHVIHAATETSLQFEIIDSLDKFTANIEGTRRVLDFAISSGASKFLFTSSGAVYGKQPLNMKKISENYVGAPETRSINTAYGQSKRASEFLCAAYANKYGLQTIIARGFAFTGPMIPLNSNLAIGNFIRDAINGNSIKITGDGTPYRSYLYAADLTIWLWFILLKGQPCHPYNVGSDKAISIMELAQMVKEVINPKVSIVAAEQFVANKPAERYVPSIERCKSELDLQISVPLKESIRRTAEWNISHPRKELVR